MTATQSALRFAVRLERLGARRAARLIGVAAYGRWQCRVFGHSTVPRIPYCFRCSTSWPAWGDVQ